METKISIVFMGTAEFAIPSLERLLDEGYDVRAVVTATDKEAGRGKKISMSPVKEFALKKNLFLLQPERLKDEDFIKKMEEINADIFVIVAFRMLPKILWAMPKYGSINIHAALLPNYRGAAPINHALINGEKKTGVSSFFLDENIDTGNIILQQECEIFPEDNFGILYDKLKIIGADICVKTLHLIETQNVNLVEQENIDINELKEAPKITKEFCKIDINKSAEEIHNFVRGLSPSPCAFFQIDDETILKIYKTSFENQIHEFPLGKIISDNKKYLKIATKDGFVFIEELQISGKKRMDIKSFLAGNKIKIENVL